MGSTSATKGPLTESIWTDLKPKLIPMLKVNRKSRLADEKLQRKEARKRKLEQIISELKGAEPPILEARISPLAPHSVSDFNSPTVQISHQRISPLAVDLLEFPIIKRLVESDVPASEVEVRFQKHRQEIQVHVLQWRVQVESHLAGLLWRGRVSDGLAVAPASILPVEESEPDPFDGVSDDLKLLLRADSLFDSAISLFQATVAYNTLMLPHDFEIFLGPQKARALDLPGYKRHAKSQEVARAILAELGIPDACFLELRHIGQRFKCGKCQSDTAYTWEGIVRHYVDEQKDWERFRDYIPKAQKLGVTIQYVHALDADPETPLVQLLESAPDASEIEESEQSNFKCLLCWKIGLHEEGVPEDEIIAHVTKWHAVDSPGKAEHYEDFGTNDPDDELGARYDSYESNSSGGYGSCGYDSYEYGSRGKYSSRRRRQYGRSRHRPQVRCAYDPDFNEDD